MNIEEILKAEKDKTLVTMVGDVQALRKKHFIAGPWADPTPLIGMPLRICSTGDCHGFHYCRLRSAKSGRFPTVKTKPVNGEKQRPTPLAELMIPIESVVPYKAKKEKAKKLKIKDQLNGISVIWKMMDADVIMYYVDVNTILKGQEPVWFGVGGTDGELSSRRLVWLDPRKIQKKKTIKSVEIEFPVDIKKYSVTHSMSRYGCIVTFYPVDLIEKAIKNKPVYRGKD